MTNMAFVFSTLQSVLHRRYIFTTAPAGFGLVYVNHMHTYKGATNNYYCLNAHYSGSESYLDFDPIS